MSEQEANLVYVICTVMGGLTGLMLFALKLRKEGVKHWVIIPFGFGLCAVATYRVATAPSEADVRNLTTQASARVVKVAKRKVRRRKRRKVRRKRAPPPRRRLPYLHVALETSSSGKTSPVPLLIPKMLPKVSYCRKRYWTMSRRAGTKEWLNKKLGQTLRAHQKGSYSVEELIKSLLDYGCYDQNKFGGSFSGLTARFLRKNGYHECPCSTE